MTKKKEMRVTIESCLDHPNGCYIRFSNKKFTHNEERNDVVIDYDKDGNIIGIEFWNGLKLIRDERQ